MPVRTCRMFPRPLTGRAVRGALTLCSASVLFSGATAHPAAKADRPSAQRTPFSAVKAAVGKELRSRKGYRPGDILSRSDVRRALDAVEKRGWKVPDRKKILNDVLPDNDFLVRELRTRRGTVFMRKLSQVPQAYDRLDRLRRLPYGPRRIRELINNPGGYTLILYLVGTRGGKNLGRYLSELPSGRKFNRPTRRIYSEQQLLQRLQRSYRGGENGEKKSRQRGS